MGLNVSGINTKDPHYAASFSDRILADMVFNGLIRFKPGHAPTLEPDLAVNIPEPEIIDGKQIWTFHLRKGVAFHHVKNHPARELTARDVLLSFQKTTDPNRSAYAGGYDGIHIEVIAPYTIRFIVDPPQSPLLFLPKVANYAGGFIVAEIDEADPNQPDKKKLIGTGPFCLPIQANKGKLILNSHPGYFRGTPRIGGVEIYFLPDSSRRLMEFDRRLDLITGESVSKWIEQIVDKKDIIIDSLGVPETANIYFNIQIKPFSDIRVRKAVAHALNRDIFIESFGHKMAKKVFSPVPPFMPGGLSEQEVRALGFHYPTDLKKARKLLTEAGYPNGFEFTVVASELGQYLKNYQSMKKQLAAVNIDVKIHLTDHATMHTLIRKGLYPVVIYEAFRPNTDEFLSRFFHSESIVTTGEKPATNFSYYSKIDKLIEKARSERITLRQIKLWEYAQIKLLEDMVVYPLHYRNQTYVRKKHLDYGHTVVAAMALYPQITERTHLLPSESIHP
jgi:peptide/nickel transport system substrate-binding protein